MEKKCSRCDIIKPIDQFTKHKAVCKDCRNAQKTELRKLSKQNRNFDGNDANPSMIYISKKITAIYNLFVKSIPSEDEFDELMLDLIESYNQYDKQKITFYFPFDVSDLTKEHLRAAYKQGLTIDSFRQSILHNERHTIVDKCGLDLHEAHKCLEELTILHHMTSAIRMGYFCINRYMKNAIKVPGADQKYEDLFVNSIYDIASSTIIVKDNPMQLTIAQFIQEVRKIIIEDKDILVVQFENLGIYDKLLAIGRNNIVNTIV